MAFNQVQNRDIITNIVNDLGINPGPDILPSTINATIQPVFEVYEKVVDVAKNVVTTAPTTSSTIYTTPADKDFYLTSVQLSFIKDASATSTASFVQTTIGGVSATILSLRQLATTAQSGSESITYNPPLKIDRNVAITCQNSTNVAAITSQACITGYIKNNRTNARG